jgi:hypothetical protein
LRKAFQEIVCADAAAAGTADYSRVATNGAMFVRYERIEDLENALIRALVIVRELDAEGALPPVLQPLTLLAPPRGFAVNVELRPFEDPDHPGEFAEDSRWDPRHGDVLITYESSRDEGGWREERRGGWRGAAPAEMPAPPDPAVAIEDVVRVLARAESDPNFTFVALKFLRDQLLPRHVPWAMIPHEAQIQINRSIDAGAVLTTKVENPRQPQYPVTAVRLNRENPIVVKVLAEPPPAEPT